MSANSYYTVVDTLYKTNVNTSADPARKSFSGSSGNYSQGEMDYWINKLFANNSEALVTSEFNSVYQPTSHLCPVASDPVAQSFFVNAVEYPNGLFLSSVEIFIATKDDNIPLTIEMRPMVNGYPSSSVIIPNTQVTINPSEINIPTTAINTSIGPATKIWFKNPVYFKPGEYALVLKSNSNKYLTYISVRNQYELGSTTNIITNTYIGSLFESQNASTWSADQNKDLCFILNRCEFDIGSFTMTAESKEIGHEETFDYIQLNTQEIQFGELTRIDYSIQTTSNTDVATTSSVLPGITYNFSETQKANVAGDILVSATFTNTDSKISPILDMTRLSTITIDNLIPAYSTTVSNSELAASGGLAGNSKYITKRVSLANNFDANGLNVYLEVNRQPGTRIEVFYKVMSGTDYSEGGFDAMPYVLMNPTNVVGTTYLTTTGSYELLPTTSVDEWVEDTYQNLNISYINSLGTTYNTFKYFAIKVVFYSNNKAIVPKIRNLRIIATTS